MYYHRVGSPQADDVLVHCTPDFPEWTLGAEVTDDGFNVVLTMSESCDTKNRLYLLPLNVDKSFSADLAAEDKKAKLFDSFVAEYSYITNEGSKFFFRTNRDAGKYRLVEIDVSLGLAGAADPATWRTVIPEHDKDVLESVRAVNHTQFAVVHSHDVAEVMSLWSQSGTLLEPRIDLPDVGSIAGIGARKEDATFFYHFSSFLYAGIIMRVELTPAAVLTAAAAAGSAAPAAVRASSVFREISVRDFNARDFETQQVFYPSKDGTMIPMFIVKRKGLKLDGTNPTWLYGYGGFNISLPRQTHTRTATANTPALVRRSLVAVCFCPNSELQRCPRRVDGSLQWRLCVGQSARRRRVRRGMVRRQHPPPPSSHSSCFCVFVLSAHSLWIVVLWCAI